MAEPRREKSLKGSDRGRVGERNTPPQPTLAGVTHLLIFFSPSHQPPPPHPFPTACHSPSLSGARERRPICIRCHNSVGNKLRPSCWLSPQHAWHFNGDCQLQGRWILQPTLTQPPPLTHTHAHPHSDSLGPLVQTEKG